MLIDLRRVSDKDFRSRLAAAGVKVSPVNPLLHGSPSVVDAPDLKPARALPPPRRIRTPALAGSNDLVKAAAQVPRAPAPSPTSDNNNTALAAGIVAGSALGLGAALLVARVNKVDEREE